MRKALLTILLITLSSSAAAALWKCTDVGGVVHYLPEAVSDGSKTCIALVEDKPVQAAPPTGKKKELGRQSANKARAQQETAPLAFVSEYVRELGAMERLREMGNDELKESGSNNFATMIRHSTRVQLELRASIAHLTGMRLKPDYQFLIKGITDLYKQKIRLHQDLIDMSSAFIAGPKPNVDLGKLAATAPKITASLEFIDESLFKLTPGIFITLIDMKADSEGHASHLLITSGEREELVRKIDSQFGAKLDEKNQHHLVGSASVLKAYLQKDFKSSDDPW